MMAGLMLWIQIMAGLAVVLCTFAAVISKRLGDSNTAHLNAALAVANAFIFFAYGAMR